jgi:hypothetical protein
MPQAWRPHECTGLRGRKEPPRHLRRGWRHRSNLPTPGTERTRELEEGPAGLATENWARSSPPATIANTYLAALALATAALAADK